MSEDILEYKSDFIEASPCTGLLQVEEYNGLMCAFHGKIRKTPSIVATFTFDWSPDQVKPSFNRIYGKLTVYTRQTEKFVQETVIEVDMPREIQKHTHEVSIPNLSESQSMMMSFEYNLYMEPTYEALLNGGIGKNDTVILVDGKEVHVNKQFLSYHSDFFLDFFNEGNENDPNGIKTLDDITFQDFGLLLSCIHPDQQRFPNDFTAEKLISLAEKFKMPAVTRLVEHHLQYSTKMSLAQVMFLAEQNNFSKLSLKKYIELSTEEIVEEVMRSPFFLKFSKVLQWTIAGKLDDFQKARPEMRFIGGWDERVVDEEEHWDRDDDDELSYSDTYDEYE